MSKFLIIGLGNIGEQYFQTRHNIGFMINDYIANKNNIAYKTQRYASLSSFRLKGRTIILLKPNTFMNLSGKAVRYWLLKEKIDINNSLVISDDIALPLGSIRIKKKGSDGGHNGLFDIIQELNTNEFSRMRFGIGNNFFKNAQSNYVLSKFTDDEMEIVKTRIEFATEAVYSFVLNGIDNTMNFFNNK